MMSQHTQLSQTNGASLEDCHTNFFTLTDLCGIKWRVYTWQPPLPHTTTSGGGDADPLTDPVLSSYAKCLSSDVLCVWRRSYRKQSSFDHSFDPLNTSGGQSSTRPPTSLKLSAKELWVFWYGDEPDLSSMVAPELSKGDGTKGSWDWETGLSYECRTILFKALHNLIERCLLREDFVRLGKWFVQPYDSPNVIPKSKNTHLSFSLNFFVHGESTVCASVDVRQQPKVRRLKPVHLTMAAQMPGTAPTPPGLPVVLAPYSLSGYLTGVSFKATDAGIQREMEQWRQFFPLSRRKAKPSTDSDDSDGGEKEEFNTGEVEDGGNMPPVVEVLIGTYKLKYPSFYVLVTDLDETTTPPSPGEPSKLPGQMPGEPTSDNTGCPLAPGHAPTAAPHFTHSPFTASSHPLIQAEYLKTGGRGLGQSRTLGERVWQEVVQSNHQLQQEGGPVGGHTPDGGLTPAELAGHWDFSDPATKMICTCVKCIGVTQGSSGILYKGIGTPGSVPPHCRNGGGMGECPPASVESQASITPSPLPTPHSQPQSVTPHHESGIATMSPQPPHSNASDLPNPSTPSDVKPSLSLPEKTDSKASVLTSARNSSYPLQVCHIPNALQLVTRGLKRPLIPDGDGEEGRDGETYHSHNLYDLTQSESWNNHPVKKIKVEQPCGDEPLWAPYRPTHHTNPYDNLKYAGIKYEDNNNINSHHPTLNGLPPHDNNPPNRKFLNSLHQSPNVKRSLNSDPYIFDDDHANGLGNHLNDSSFKVEIKDEPKSGHASPHTPHSPALIKKSDSLYTSEGLQPSPSDLNKIFDTDSPADDNNYPDHTPPGSNHSMGGGVMSDDLSSNVNKHNTNSFMKSNMGNTNHLPNSSGTVSLGELTKMYPTPPSLEHNNIDHDSGVDEVGGSNPICSNNIPHTSNLNPIKQEPPDDYGLVSSLPDYGGLVGVREGDSKGLTVFRPTNLSMFVGSDSYRPLLDLPSVREPVQRLPNSVYKPSWQLNSNDKSNSSNSNNNNNNVNSNSQNSQLSDKLSQRLSSHHLPQSYKLGPISPAIDRTGGPSSVGGIGGPSSVGAYDSPASNQSSYLNKTISSVEPNPPSTSASHSNHPNSGPEANALLVNLVLMDSSLNVFRDHNFDSCTMCVCNNDQKVVGNVRGSDGALYLPPSYLSPTEENIACSCGFSAVINRRLAFQAGLFYEDEVDLTGLHEELMVQRKKPSLSLMLENGADKINSNDNSDMSLLDRMPESLFKLVQQQCVDTLCINSSVVQRAATVYRRTRPHIKVNVVELKDGNELVHLALDQARLDQDSGAVVSAATARLNPCVMHKWAYYQYDGPACSQDLTRCMTALQPHLQEAIQKKRSSRPWEPVFNVRGPLTWRHFHRMAVRGTEDLAEPLPIPMLLAGHDKDWVSVAPQAIKHWERLMLEPYSQQRDIAYVVVSPDNEFVLNHVRSFFKELSSVYELCKLGRHAPIQRVLRDGIMRVSKTAAAKVANESLDDWFTMLGDSQISTKLKFYSQVCRHRLAPHLTTLSMDKSLFDVGNSRSGSSAPNSDQRHPSSMSPMPPPSMEGGASLPQSSDPNAPQGDGGAVYSGTTSGGNVFGPGCSLIEAEEEEGPPPAIMVYLVDPFSVSQDHPEMHRLITLGLLRCYKQMLDCLPPHMQSNVHVQIISLESIVELAAAPHSLSRQSDQLKCLAFSVFTQCRRFLKHTNNVRSLTGFGPASIYDSFLKPKDPNEEEKASVPFAVFSPPYILSSIKENRHKKAEEALGAPVEKSTVLYCTYCLSEDQHWLLAVVTDSHGEMLETITINVEVPDRTRRKKASSRRPGLKKLMEWILGIMSTNVHPWRLVVGKMGRMGHGELKGWLHLLSRKSLLHSSKTLRDLCKQCDYLFPGAAPCILSACLVSLEPDSSFRMMPDIFTPDERFGQTSQNCNLNTPQDLTSTHILVFPTSATAQSAQQRLHDEPPFQFGNDDDSLLLTDIGGDDMGGGMDMGIGINYMDIIMDGNNEPDPMEDGGNMSGNDNLSLPSSPNAGYGGSGMEGGRGRGSSSPSQASGQALSNGKVLADPHEDDTASLQQQPLALGYYISTASTGNLPRWFWSSCPHLENVCPVFLKSALHLNQPAVTQAEDVLPNTTNKAHPLDSTCTADVLRFVLEGYNGLSWLVLDPSTQDRRSCLPVHMQTLSNLYNAMAALV